MATEQPPTAIVVAQPAAATGAGSVAPSAADAVASDPAVTPPDSSAAVADTADGGSADAAAPSDGPATVDDAESSSAPAIPQPQAKIVIVPDSAPGASPVANPPAPMSPEAAKAAVEAAANPSTLAWGAVVSPEFAADVKAMCARLGCQPSDMMAAMAFESAETFSPSVRNPTSGATGLIQFMSDTAENLGTSIDDLAAMSPEQQLTYVEAYFRPFRGHLSSLSDIYMAILWPRAVGQPDDFPLFPDGSPQYAQNSYLDVDGDGMVTKQEAAALVTAKLQKGERPEFALRAPSPASSEPA